MANRGRSLVAKRVCDVCTTGGKEEAGTYIFPCLSLPRRWYKVHRITADGRYAHLSTYNTFRRSSETPCILWLARKGWTRMCDVDRKVGSQPRHYRRLRFCALPGLYVFEPFKEPVVVRNDDYFHMQQSSRDPSGPTSLRCLCFCRCDDETSQQIGQTQPIPALATLFAGNLGVRDSIGRPT